MDEVEEREENDGHESLNNSMDERQEAVGSRTADAGRDWVNDRGDAMKRRNIRAHMVLLALLAAWRDGRLQSQVQQRRRDSEVNAKQLSEERTCVHICMGCPLCREHTLRQV